MFFLAYVLKFNSGSDYVQTIKFQFQNEQQVASLHFCELLFHPRNSTLCSISNLPCFIKM